MSDNVTVFTWAALILVAGVLAVRGCASVSAQKAALDEASRECDDSCEPARGFYTEDDGCICETEWSRPGSVP